ncbi:SURF1 family protein [Niveibacterium sp. SC-1]|uniref:SURF1 family protein n=1 Tax=Niveibacterium sp. SC-1 TaxID=3135646 RepID=UPI00311FE42D
MSQAKPLSTTTSTARRSTRWLPFVAGIALALLCARLGFWQLDRAALKEAWAHQYQAALDAPPLPLPQAAQARDAAGRRVWVSGRWAPERTVWVDNRTHGGKAGVHVVTPIRRVDGSFVYIDRGWAAIDGARRVLPAPPLQAGEVKVQGVAISPPERSFSLGDASREGRLWSALDEVHLRAAMPAAGYYPLFVQLTDETGDGLIRDWAAPAFGAERSRAYALQWFVFSFMAFALSLWFGLRGRRKHAS